ncbi:MAG: hypothetical protein HY749_15910 [Gammaproteobacteria bacterium]|nr:hypothetical protein [Gammaproteobacteria bacterium]
MDTSNLSKFDDQSFKMRLALGHLHAMLTTVVGDGFESFSHYSVEIQNDYLDACRSKAAECETLLDGLDGIARPALSAEGVAA